MASDIWPNINKLVSVCSIGGKSEEYKFKKNDFHSKCHSRQIEKNIEKC